MVWELYQLKVQLLRAFKQLICDSDLQDKAMHSKSVTILNDANHHVMKGNISSFQPKGMSIKGSIF